MLVRRWLSKSFSAEEINKIELLINASTSKDKMKHIYEHYKAIADEGQSSTGASKKPINEIAPVIQAFTRSKLSQNIRQSKQPLVMPKPPKSVSTPKQQVPERLIPVPKMTETQIPSLEDMMYKHYSKGAASQTSQTQTLVPLNAFKFIEKGENRFLEPITPEKADDLAMKKKTIKSETILSPDRFKRKPHVWYSRYR